MDLDQMILTLESKDTKQAYEILKELEAISNHSNILYPYIDKFIDMSGDETYVIRVRGFRLLCKQAKWDIDHRIDENIGKVLNILIDEKPTAVRQALAALKDLVPYKKELHSILQNSLRKIDYMKYKDTMHGLIAKDIEEVLRLIID